MNPVNEHLLLRRSDPEIEREKDPNTHTHKGTLKYEHENQYIPNKIRI